MNTAVRRAIVSATALLLAGTPRPARAQEQSSVTGGGYRLQIRVFTAANRSATPVLLVVLHGDAPFSKPDYQNRFAERVAASTEDVVAVGLLRPGYTDPEGHRSDGERGLTTGDNYNATNTDAVAAAIGALKRRFHARKVVVAGHSGGSAITANILGRHPGLIDAALLVSCPCDVEQWRLHMYQRQHAAVFLGRIETLSPIDLIQGVSQRASVVMMVGSQDDVAPPALTLAYHAAAARLGKHVTVIQLPGKGHEIFLDDEVFATLAPMLDPKAARATPPHGPR